MNRWSVCCWHTAYVGCWAGMFALILQEETLLTSRYLGLLLSCGLFSLESCSSLKGNTCRNNRAFSDSSQIVDSKKNILIACALNSYIFFARMSFFTLVVKSFVISRPRLSLVVHQLSAHHRLPWHDWFAKDMKSELSKGETRVMAILLTWKGRKTCFRSMFLGLDFYECCGFGKRTLRLQWGLGEVSACSLSSLACQRAVDLGPALKQDVVQKHR